jgi:hypothetical protein
VDQAEVDADDDDPAADALEQSGPEPEVEAPAAAVEDSEKDNQE